MGIFSQLFERRAHPGTPGDLFDSWRSPTAAGVYVSEDTALTMSAVYACIRVLAEGVAMLPLLTYRRLPSGGKERATDHPLYDLLRESPNPEMTSFEYRETMIGNAAARGNAFSEIEWNGRGEPVALWPLRTDMMDVQRRGGALRYDYTLPNGQSKTLQWYQVHHLRGLSGNGVTGYSPVKMAMQGIGLGLATEEFGSRFFGNGARPGGVIMHPGRLSEPAYKRMQSSWSADHQGLSQAHRIKILEEGVTYQAIGIAPEEAQFLETRKFQVNEIARWFRIPPHMIGDLENASFSNIEEQGLEFVIYTLAPWLIRSEQALMRDLLVGDEERTEYFIEYLVDGLLRGDIQSRYAAYSIGRQNGWLSANEIRELENMNPVDGGDEYLIPLNMVPAGGDGSPVAIGAGGEERGRAVSCDCGLPHETRADDDAEPDDVRRNRTARQRMARSYVRLYEDAAGRVVRRETNDMRRAVNKHLRNRSLDSFRDWMIDFYADFRGVLSDQFLQLMLTYADQVVGDVAGELDQEDPGITDELREFIDGYLESFATQHVASSQNQINAIIDTAILENEEPADLIDARLDGWEETQPRKIALQQAFEALNALAVAAYGIMGVRRLRWAASGDSCPFCTGLNGRTIGIEGFFVDAGTQMDAGEDGPMLVRHNKRHGPLHRGCDCVVLAG